MRVHAIFYSYLGDGELDIGKTTRWAQYFCDSLFFYDANSSSDARKYVINYAKSFPDCQFAYHPTSAAGFQQDPAVMRKMGFQAADAAWGFDATDWVLIIDGTEGLSTDSPHDSLEWWPNTEKFRYLYDEAHAAVQPYLGMPFRVFLNQGTVAEHDYLIDPTLGDVPINHAVWWSCTPQYLSDTALPTPRYLLRMARVDWLRTATATNFRAMDTFNLGSYPLAQHVSLISYGYARYSEDPPPWTQAHDIGFTNRLFMQQVPGRNVSELPVNYATPDPAGFVITVPFGPARILAFPTDTDVYTYDFTGHVTKESGNETYTWNWTDASPNSTGQNQTHTFPGAGPYNVVVSVADPDVGGGPRTATVRIAPNTVTPITPQPPDPAPTLPGTRMLSGPYCYYMNMSRGVYVMQFTALWRLHPRDGVWWESSVLGPPPVNPVTGAYVVDPDVWYNQQPTPRATVGAPPNETTPGV